MSAASAYAELRDGSKLGPYQLLVAVAQGGMARVWAARHLPTGRLVAVKTIRPELAENATYQRLFSDEARFAAAVRHPNVCEVFGLSEAGGVLFIAMEWVEGESLARILKPTRDDPVRPVDPRIAARIIAECAEALHAAHEVRAEDGSLVRIVHADVSPQNLMLTTSGQAKLVDFGVARAVASRKPGDFPQLDGKAAYMAPEHAAGKRLSRLSDVFTLGVCLYEISTGVRPFATGNREATIERLLKGEFPPPSDVVPDYPTALERVLRRAMAMEPAHRYPSALRLKAALEEFITYSGPALGAADLAEFVIQRAGAIISERETVIRNSLSGR
ncbi:MAG: serine/threonine protein kinase [Myxococcales bacterium]|nr:serine/threonine protein kinase [Myxococcales bacterium]